MFESVKNFFRRRKIRKLSRAVPTGLRPLDEISTINVVINVEEVGYDTLKEEILAWGKSIGKKVDIYYFDFRKLGKNELLLTSIQTTVSKNDLNWFGIPEYGKVSALIEEPSDLLVSLVDNSDFPIDFVAKCSAARFKIGRRAYPGHCYDIVCSGKQAEGLPSGGHEVFQAITEFLNKISK
jgi:hypothetical protein